MFSILIPTFNNHEYLKFCIRSLKNNSNFNNQIICHVNVGEDETINFLKQNNIDYTHTSYNAGICEGINKATKLAKFDYLLYAHDDFYFCPSWDKILSEEVKKIGHNNFYLSGTMMNQGQIAFNCGDTPDNFNEKKFLDEYKNYNFYDFQGSTWAPHLIHKDLWNKVGGFSEEFYPGTGSDPDLNMKLWKENVRIFKGLGKCLVFHFGSVVSRRDNKDNKIKTESGNKGNKIFLLKWGITIKFFKKFYLKSDIPYVSELKDPKKDINYIYHFILCKINYLYVKYIYRLKK